jgi:hypothetical protein
MPSPWSTLAELLADRLDADLVPLLYTAASVSPSQIRSEFEEDGIPYLDPDTGRNPPQAELILAAERVIRDSRNQATALAAAAGLAGAVAVPPEVLANMIQMLRLAQRLSVLFGFDPETDAGKLVMFRALAAAYELELPPQAQVGLKVRDLPMLLRNQVPATRNGGAWLLRQVTQRSVAMAVRRVVRMVPGLGTGLSAWGALRRVEKAGQRMVEVLHRASAGAGWELGEESLAVEVS